MDDPDGELDEGHGYGTSQAGSGMECGAAQGSQGPRTAESYVRLFEQGLGNVQLSPEQLVAVAQVFAGSLGDRNPAKLSIPDEGGGWQRAKGPRVTRKPRPRTQVRARFGAWGHARGRMGV